MRIRVEGRQALNGLYRPAGNSNAAMALLAAALLTDQPVKLRNMPNTAHVQTMLTIAEKLGAKMAWAAPEVLSLQTEQITKRALTLADTNGLVGALLFLPALLVRRQYARLEIDFPLNRIKSHLEALRDLGVEVNTSINAIECQKTTWEHKELILTQASVTATAMVMMLAACLGKETIVYNAACEPQVQQLGHLLCGMGAHIEGIGSNVLRILSPPGLEGGEAVVGPDYIEAASIAAISALCGGRVRVEGSWQADTRLIVKAYRQLGIRLDSDVQAVHVPHHEGLHLSTRPEDTDLSIESAPWPAFPSDLIAVATVVATQARGTTLIHEKLFNNRLLFVDKLKAMGAQIILCDPHRAIVVGSTPLHSIYMDTPDVRAGLGMLAAALVAEGESVIDNAQVIERAFAGVLKKLQILGATITLE